MTTYTELKEVKEFCDNQNIDDWKEVAENIIELESDFEVNDHRFIRDLDIDEIQENELKEDLYTLGCFTDWFIAENTNVPLKAVKALQEAEAFEALGELMLDDIHNIQRDYASTDGYGHHFNHYDGNEIEVELIGVDYHVFRTN